MTKHTPGPWRFIKNVGDIVGSDGVGPFGPREVQVGTVGDYSDKELLRFNKERWDADGRLIAAAPDLLNALQKAERFIANGIELGYIRMPDPDTPDSAHETLPAIRAALKAAQPGDQT